MAKDCAKIAAEIIRLAGGKENIRSAAYCATRLRLILVDREKVNEKEMEEVEGVKGTFFNAGQFQVILGSQAADVYAEAIGLGVSAATSDDIRYI